MTGCGFRRGENPCPRAKIKKHQSVSVVFFYFCFCPVNKVKYIDKI